MIAIKAEILQKQNLAEGTYLLKIKAPEITKSIRPGQYIILELEENVRVPMFIAEAKGAYVSVIFSESDRFGGQLLNLKKGMSVPNVIGPLGQPIKICEMGNVCFVTEGSNLGATALLAETFKKYNNRIYLIAGFKSKRHKYWESRTNKLVDKHFFVVEKKNLTGIHPILKEVNNLLRRKHMPFVIANCNLPLMKDITNITRMRSKMIASLLPLIKDGMGLCGGCRVSVEKETKLSCIEGPFLDAHSLNWKEILNRHDYTTNYNDCFCKKYHL